METAPRNCRFLSLVVVERVLITSRKYSLASRKYRKYSLASQIILNRRPPTNYTATSKDFRSKKGFRRGWCMNCQNLREQQNVYHPQDCTGDVHHCFCGGGARIVGFDQEWPRQTKPKKGQLTNFPQGHSRTKFNVNRACFPKEKHQNSQKWAEFMNFSFWPFLWFGLLGRLMIRFELGCRKWGCNKWGFKGCLAAPPWKSAEIGLFRPFSAFFALFWRVRRVPGKSRKRKKKAFFLRYPQICLNPHLLIPHLRRSN